jgi:hypothetical protein
MTPTIPQVLPSIRATQQPPLPHFRSPEKLPPFAQPVTPLFGPTSFVPSPPYAHTMWSSKWTIVVES